VNSYDGVSEWSFSKVTDPKAISFRRVFPANLPWINSSLSGDGSHLAITSDKPLRLINLETREERGPVKTAFSLLFSALNSDASLAAIWHRNYRNIEIWDVRSTNTVQTFDTSEGVSAAFSPDDRIFMAGDHVEFRAWSIPDWKSLFAIKRDHAGYWGLLAFAPDSRVAALLISRTALRLIDTRTGQELATLEAPEPVNIKTFTFSKDGTMIAASTETAVQLWDLTAIRSELAARNLDWQSPTEMDAVPEISK
jgi:WD40 repeat protein